MPSTKDTAHIRRSKGLIGNTINFSSDMTLDVKKDVFLANPQNKQKFISNLRQKFTKNDIKTLQAEGDADLLIVKVAVESAETDPTVLVGEDTDLFVLLCHYASPEANDIFFKPGQRRNRKTAARVRNIKETKQKLGVDLCKDLLFLHAVLGCDKTSSVFGLGKGLARVFINDESSSVDDIISYGERAMIILFGGKPEKELDSLRLGIFYQKVAGSVQFAKP